MLIFLAIGFLFGLGIGMLAGHYLTLRCWARIEHCSSITYRENYHV